MKLMTGCPLLFQDMIPLYYFLFGILGLLIGSFLNVCICRIPKGESIITGRSHCTKCNHSLNVLDLFPVVSFLFLGGKCRYCKEKISPRYAIVEFLTALTYVILFHKYKISIDFFAAAYLMSILIIVFFIDLEHMIIPDGLVIAGLIGGVLLFVYNIFGFVQIYGDRNWWNPLLGGLIGFGLLFLIATLASVVYKTDEAMGGGDIKIFAPIGLFLGWRMTGIALLTSFLFGGIIGIIIIFIKGKESRRTVFPLGPFIVLGTFFTYLFGWNVLNWYLGTLNIY
ncbi:MAG: prepilin peptidase [Clostridium sp.]|nr:prepilin peptidase [Clostridium sp.]